MFARIGNACLILALLAAMDMHWTVLQSFAWSRMLAANLRTTSIYQAVENTIDGKHPCSLCKKIAAGKKSEQKTAFPSQLKKFEFLRATPSVAFDIPSHDYCVSMVVPSPKSLLRVPPTPPPRLVLA